MPRMKSTGDFRPHNGRTSATDPRKAALNRRTEALRALERAEEIGDTAAVSEARMQVRDVQRLIRRYGYE
jgi:hypothetical protein